MEIIGDNTTRTSIAHKGKVVAVRREQKRYTLALQFVDEMGTPVINLSVMAENDVTRSGYIPANALHAETDGEGIVKFKDLHWCNVRIFTDAQQLADEMEKRPLSISRNPNSQPTSKNIFLPETRDKKWRSNVQISAEQKGYTHHYVTLGELCNKAPHIADWPEEAPLPAFHFQAEKALKGLEIPRAALNKRHVIEICPFRAWTLALSDVTDYSVVNGLNLGVMADLAYSDGDTIAAFFNQRCQDLSTTPQHTEFPAYFHVVSVDVPFSERYLPPVFMDTKNSENQANDVGAVARGLDSTQLFSVECCAHIIVAWRGTQEVADWLTDGLFAPVKCPPELAASGSIHGGFHEAYKLAKAKFKDNFRAIKQALDKGNFSKKIFICGHSLGGALGLTYAAEMKNFQPILHTYGMPRTFTADAVKCLGTLAHFRHVNDSDTIPSVPPDAYVDNWLYSRFSYLGQTLGFFWTALVQIPGQALGIDMGNHFWHHGDPVVFFRATQTVESTRCDVLMNRNTCRTVRYLLANKTKLYLAPTLSMADSQEARQQQEALVKEMTPESMKKLFPPNTNPSFDHGTSVFQHSMSGQYLPFLNNQVLESAWPELEMSRKKRRAKFKAQMAHSDIPPEELTRNRIFLNLHDMVAGTLHLTRKIPGGEDALIRFKSAAEEEIELI